MPQLLPSAPIPVSQFASISILTKQQKSKNHGHQAMMVRPVLTISPTCTLSRSMATAAIAELHDHVLRNTTSATTTTRIRQPTTAAAISDPTRKDDDEEGEEEQDDYTSQLLREDNDTGSACIIA
jgi:hypothetical protein